MYRVAGVIVAAVMLTTSNGPLTITSRLTGAQNTSIGERAEIDVAALLASARGAPPIICSLASQSLRNFGWGDWSDAPATPLSNASLGRNYDFGPEQLAAADVERLLEGLANDDPCVREISVRLLGRQRGEPVVTGLITRLTAATPSLREVSALGLGLVKSSRAVDPLIRALRDATGGVRANSAWALGRLEAGKALGQIRDMFRDDDQRVREAAVIASGRMDDSTSSIPALIRVVRQDSSPQVRRAAAWALGQLESREAIEALTGVLTQDTDARVREMAAWALGQVEGRSAIGGLSTAARRDADDRVRETATWALGQLEDRSVVEVLGNIAASDKSSRVRGTAAWALGQLRGGKAPAGLLQVLRDENDDARLKAAWALGQIGDATAIPAIREALQRETSSEVRRALIRALMRSGERSQATLTDLLNSGDPQVREAAVRGLAGNNSFNPWPWQWPRPRTIP
jgi:HEAT repeat protein